MGDQFRPVEQITRERLSARPGESPERRRCLPAGSALDFLPEAERLVSLIQPDLRDQRHWPQPAARTDETRRPCAPLIPPRRRKRHHSPRSGWHDGHQKVTRSAPGVPRPARPSAMTWVPQRRHGRPALPYTHVSCPRAGLPVVTWLARSLLASSRRWASSTTASRSSIAPTGRHGLIPRRNSTSAL